MSLSMHSLIMPVLTRSLTTLSQVLEKGEAHARERDIEPQILLQSRLHPDMLPLLRQVQIATDVAKGCAARLAGREPPVFEDSETRFDELQARIARVRAYVADVAPAELDGAEARTVTIRLRGHAVEFDGLTYLQYFVLPNLFFHCTTAYAILRHNGVALGKADFLGRP